MRCALCDSFAWPHKPFLCGTTLLKSSICKASITRTKPRPAIGFSNCWTLMDHDGWVPGDPIPSQASPRDFLLIWKVTFLHLQTVMGRDFLISGIPVWHLFILSFNKVLVFFLMVPVSLTATHSLAPKLHIVCSRWKFKLFWFVLYDPYHKILTINLVKRSQS